MDIENRLYLYYDNNSREYSFMLLDIRRGFASMEKLTKRARCIEEIYRDLEFITDEDALKSALPGEDIRAFNEEEIKELNFNMLLP